MLLRSCQFESSSLCVCIWFQSKKHLMQNLLETAEAVTDHLSIQLPVDLDEQVFLYLINNLKWYRLGTVYILGLCILSYSNSSHTIFSSYCTHVFDNLCKSWWHDTLGHFRRQFHLLTIEPTRFGYSCTLQDILPLYQAMTLLGCMRATCVTL